MTCRRPHGHSGRCVGELPPPPASPLAVRRPPPVYVQPDDRGDHAAYVKLPLPPGVVSAFREHAANASRLLELLTGTETAAADILRHIGKTAAALERDVSKLRRRRRR